MGKNQNSLVVKSSIKRLEKVIDETWWGQVAFVG